jgi:hypothetical protein
MQNGKVLPILLKTAIFTAIVPYAVGLWLPTQANHAFDESPFIDSLARDFLQVAAHRFIPAFCHGLRKPVHSPL